MKKGTS